VGIFDGQVVVVTGAARGLGRDYAKYFAADGAHVVLADLKEPTSAAADAAKAGPRCLAAQADVTDRDSVAALMRRCRDEFGRLDVLINNAGMWRGLAEAGLLGIDDELWDAAWRLNVTGSLRCFQEAVPLMAEREYGRIVNVSSIASRQGNNAYGLTKNAVEQMTRGMAIEAGEHGITVNCLAPGIAAFEAAQSQLPNADAMVAGNVVKRVGASRELYEGLRYLCAAESSWITGQTLRVDGGASAR
jgi:3-oxoacyl-[acyl-carrier protein] reductase